MYSLLRGRSRSRTATISWGDGSTSTVKVIKNHIGKDFERKHLRDQEIDYLQQVGRVTAAAIRAGTFQLERLDEVANRPDEPGQLALVFQEVARQVYAREQQLKQQVKQLRIEIDQARNSREIADITESDYFQQLLGKAEELRTGSKTTSKRQFKGVRAKIRCLYTLREGMDHEN